MTPGKLRRSRSIHNYPLLELPKPIVLERNHPASREHRHHHDLSQEEPQHRRHKRRSRSVYEPGGHHKSRRHDNNGLVPHSSSGYSEPDYHSTSSRGHGRHRTHDPIAFPEDPYGFHHKNRSRRSYESLSDPLPSSGVRTDQVVQDPRRGSRYNYQGQSRVINANDVAEFMDTVIQRTLPAVHMHWYPDLPSPPIHSRFRSSRCTGVKKALCVSDVTLW